MDNAADVWSQGRDWGQKQTSPTRKSPLMVRSTSRNSTHRRGSTTHKKPLHTLQPTSMTKPVAFGGVVTTFESGKLEHDRNPGRQERTRRNCAEWERDPRNYDTDRRTQTHWKHNENGHEKSDEEYRRFIIAQIDADRTATCIYTSSAKRFDAKLRRIWSPKITWGLEE